jgi:hypothetical protein
VPSVNDSPLTYDSCIIGDVSTLESTDQAPDDADRAGWHDHIAQLLGAGDIKAARDSVERAIHESGRNAECLWLLADVEFADGNPTAGTRVLAEAVNVAEDDADALSHQVQMLTAHRQLRQALQAVESMPAQARDDPRVRTSIGAFYEACHCHAHAVYGYGTKTGLGREALVARRSSWLRSGGPVSSIRGRLNSWEETELLSQLRRAIDVLAELEPTPGIDARRAEVLRTQIENMSLEGPYPFKFWTLIFRWQLRLLPLAVAPVWLVLFLIALFVGFISGTPGPVTGTGIGAVVAVAVPIAVFRTFMRRDLSIRIMIPFGIVPVLCILAVAAEAAAAEAYSYRDLPTVGWWSWAVLGLVTIPATSLCMLCSAILEGIVANQQIGRVVEENCEPALILTLASVLHEIRSSSHINAARRLRLARNLEWTADHIRRDLLPPSSLRVIASGDWLSRRAAGWAEALRYMQREVVTPVPGGQAKLEARLRHEIRCLAVGDFGALAWRQPPPPSSKRASLARKAVAVVRTIVVAALPLGAILTAQAIIHSPNDIFRWADIVSAAWLLLYAVISLDPALRDKIEAARSLAGLIGDARRIR